MANSFQIGNVIPRLFNGSKYESTNRSSNQATVGKTYNPFAKSNMKVDVLTADVFETTSFTGGGSTSSISKIKRMAATFAGSLGDMFPTFRKGIESITAFCGRIKSGITGTWNFLNETRIPGITDVGRVIRDNISAANYNREVKAYASMPTSTLRELLTDCLSTAA